MIFWLFLCGPILVPLMVGIILIAKLKNRLGVRANVVIPRFSGFFFGWGAALTLAWIIFVIVASAINGGAQGPLAIFLAPWAFSIGAAVGVARWYRKHYAT
jgi:hypothetical protein